MDSCLRRNEGGGGDHPAPFTAEGAESAEGEEGLALTPVSSMGQALALSQDGRGDGSEEGAIREWRLRIKERRTSHRRSRESANALGRCPANVQSP